MDCLAVSKTVLPSVMDDVCSMSIMEMLPVPGTTYFRFPIIGPLQSPRGFGTTTTNTTQICFCFSPSPSFSLTITSTLRELLLRCVEGKPKDFPTLLTALDFCPMLRFSIPMVATLSPIVFALWSGRIARSGLTISSERFVPALAFWRVFLICFFGTTRCVTGSMKKAST